MGEAHRVVELDAGEVDRVAHLFQELVGFHREVVDGAWPVRREEDAWELRRRQYQRWLGEGTARMLAAVPAAEPGGAPEGYAVLSIGPGGASWDLGERIGELETLVVAEAARSQGIGTMLIEACRERLRAEGVRHWGVAVVEANEDAVRLYERAGFRPYYRNLLAEL
ncbi:MAG TPA: GNAT family N-acetyltransferase [Solirubrobacterales bacterium]|nr:GNAT family N-acetyltransferase [Solirubrobacterales bacterium]